MVLQVEEITKHFEGLAVLQDVTLDIDSGEIVGLIGPNGAGKTTLFNVITGIYAPNSGMILFRQDPIVGLKPHQICRKGIARTFQLVKIFPSMTVLDNVLVGAIYGRTGTKKGAMSEALECLKLLDLSNKKDRIAAQLTHSDQRLVEIARALAAEPALALLDEPLAGLNPQETSRVASLIQEIRDKTGTSILWVEHKMEAIFKTCDRVVVLDYGEKIAEGKPEDIADNEKVMEAYIGEPLT
jgi:branched-chain amino acid transport system ATP-binding protein